MKDVDIDVSDQEIDLSDEDLFIKYVIGGDHHLLYLDSFLKESLKEPEFE